MPVAPRIPSTPQALVGPIATVTNIDDSGAGSLRQAIIDAAPGTTIQFDPGITGQTIVLTAPALNADKPLTIEGPADKGMTISGGLTTRILNVGNSATVVLRNLSIVNGRFSFAGGLLLGSGSLTLDHVLVANNEAQDNGGGILVRVYFLFLVVDGGALRGLGFGCVRAFENPS